MKLQNDLVVGGGRELALLALFAIVPFVSVIGAEWSVCHTNTIAGITPSQQLTNAVTQAESGDTIRFEAGIYQLDGESFTGDFTINSSSSVPVRSRNYVLINKVLHFVGASAGKWDDATVLRGNGYDRFFYGVAKGSTFRNLTFENFASSDHTEQQMPAGNMSPMIVGGAIVFASKGDGTGNAMNLFSDNIVSNCVFRGNVSRSAGAISSLWAIDCYFTNNVAVSYNGGVGMKVDMLRCRCVDNRAPLGQAGAVWWQGSQTDGLRDSEFIGNSAKLIGAVSGESDGVISNCVFRGNRATNGGCGAVSLRINGKIMDCTFEENSSTDNAGAISSGNAGTGVNGGRGSLFTRCRFIGNRSGANGGAVSESHALEDGPLEFRDCWFSNNYATVSAGAIFGGTCSNCTFFGNSCGTGNSSKEEYGGAVRLRPEAPGNLIECLFVSNHFTRASGTHTLGAAVYAYTTNLVKGCVFYGNYVTNTAGDGYLSVVYCGNPDKRLRVVDCAFTNNYASKGGLVRYSDCTNSIFYGNEVPRDGVVNHGTIIDCRFVGNKKADTFWGITYSTSGTPTPEANVPSGDAFAATLLRCDMDLGCLFDCVAVDCRIHTLTNKGAYCVFYGHNVVTNCLVSNCRPPDQGRALVYRWGARATANVSGSDYVNCTFVDNVFPKFLFHAQENGIATPFKNCVWANNKTQYNTLCDVGFDVKNDTSSPVDSGISLSNCVYGSIGIAPGVSKQITWTDLGGNRTVSESDLKMAGNKAAKLGVDKYSLLLSSPVLGMGDASMFGADDLDLAGNLRLRNGKLDPGCFQCWLNIVGTCLMLR